MMRGLSRTSRDVRRFCIMVGTHTLRSINVVGLKLAGISNKTIHALRHAFTKLFGARQNLKLAIARLLESNDLAPEGIEMVDFIRESNLDVYFSPDDARD